MENPVKSLARFKCDICILLFIWTHASPRISLCFPSRQNCMSGSLRKLVKLLLWQPDTEAENETKLFVFVECEDTCETG